MPSKTTEAGSAPSAPRTNALPLRSAQIASCSAAAARNVSPATSSTRLFSLRRRIASLPIVVVLPLPLTPTTRMTVGVRSSRSSDPGKRQKAFDVFTEARHGEVGRLPRFLARDGLQTSDDLLRSSERRSRRESASLRVRPRTPESADAPGRPNRETAEKASRALPSEERSRESQLTARLLPSRYRLYHANVRSVNLLAILTACVIARSQAAFSLFY